MKRMACNNSRWKLPSNQKVEEEEEAVGEENTNSCFNKTYRKIILMISVSFVVNVEVVEILFARRV
jgi:hypothetical protein